jgi:hypothetical protein
MSSGVYASRVAIEASLPTIATSLLPNIRAWYKSESFIGVADGTPISLWPDSSGNGFDMTASGVNRPFVKAAFLAGRPVVRFTDSGPSILQSLATFANIQGAGGASAVFVFQHDPTGAGAEVLWNSGGQVKSFVDSGFLFSQNIDSGGADSVSKLAADNVWHIGVWRHDLTMNTLYVSVDNTNATAEAVVGSGPTVSLTGPLMLGSDGLNPFKGYIAEIIFLDTRLNNEANRRTISTYLREKYKILHDASTANFPFVELPDVQISQPITISRGIMGSTQRDRVAQTGTLAFQLDNSANNGAGKLGLYSLNHVNTLLGWDVGTPVRCVVTYAGVAETMFRGTVAAIDIISGKYGERKVNVHCVDWMEEAARAKVHGIPIQVNKRSDEIFTTLVLRVPQQPIAVEAGIGGDTYPFALDNAFDAELNVMSEFQRLAQSELGYIYLKRNGTLVFEGRHKRPNALVPVETFTDADIFRLEAAAGREAIVNRAEVEAHPRRVDSVPVVLFALNSVLRIERSTSVLVNSLYRDPQQRATRVGGLTMIVPVASTDYLFNELETGLGVDLTSQLTVSAIFGGNSAEVLVVNNGPSDGFLTKLELRGFGVYDFETILAISESAVSKTRYGCTILSLDMPYQSDIRVAQDAADFIISSSKSLLTPVQSVTVVANRSDRMMRNVLQREISERVRVMETVVGTNPIIPVGDTVPVAALDFFIQGVELSILERGVITCTWFLAQADPYTYWILEIPGYTELGLTTRLGYGSFIAGWILGTSVLGTGTRVNQ